MAQTLEGLGLGSLTLADRLELAEELWVSVHEALGKIPLDSSVREEILRRASLADADPHRGVRWEEVLAGLAIRPTK
jgi:putative addiction module component (TIGR02574 family)